MIADNGGYETQGEYGDELVFDDYEAATVRDKELGGWILESKIPLHNLANENIAQLVPAAGMTIGFDFSVLDVDLPCPGIHSLRRYPYERGAIASSLVILRMFLNHQIAAEFLMMYLDAPLFFSEIQKYNNGTAQPNLAANCLEQFMFPLPPLAEQKRIVAQIEELLPYLDRYEKAWNRLEDFGRRFPADMQKSILQIAIQGKLVEQRPEEGTGEALYRQIQAEKQALIKAGKIKKEKPLPVIAEDEVPFEIPEGWKWVRIGDVFTTSSGTTPSKSVYEYYSSADYNWVRTTDLNNSILSTCQIGISQKAFEECRLSIIPQDSVCVAMYGGAGTIGKNAIIKFDTTINQSVCAIHPNGFCDMTFLQRYLQYYRPAWMKMAAGSRKDPNINQIIIKNAIFPLPPLAEQKRIVARLEEILPLCERLK